MPDYLSSRILSEDEIVTLQKACIRILDSEEETENIKSTIDNFVRFCGLLARPENHILMPGRQYVDRQVNIRTEADMAGEVVRKLTGLPKYTAYTKILQEREGTHAVWTGKIWTLKLKKMPELPETPKGVKCTLLALQTQPYMWERIQIEEETRQRQESWKSLAAASPPISTTK